jgi:hypothetical protein
MDFINQLISAAHRQWEIIRHRRPATNLFYSYWQAIRNHMVAREILKVKVILRRLYEERNVLNERHRVREQEIVALNTSEIVVRYKLRQANHDLFLCAVLVFSILTSGYWVVTYVHQEWRLAVLTIYLTAPIGIHFSTRTLKLTPGFKRIVNIIAVFIALAVIAGSGCLYMSRVNAMKSETQLQDTLSGETGDDLVRSEAEKLKHLQSNSRSFSQSMSLAMFFLGLMADVVLGLMYAEAMENRAGAVAALYLFRQLRKIKAALVKNAEAIEGAKQRPGILYHQLTIRGLTQEAKEARAEQSRQREETRRRRLEEKRLSRIADSGDIGVAIRKGSLAFLVLVLIIVICVAAFAADTDVLGIDRSTSAQFHGEFKQNLKAAGYYLKNISTPGTRAVLLGITEQSFGAPVILDWTVPTEIGRFGERLSSARLQVLKELEIKTQILTPTEKGSDLFGFFARASLILKDGTIGTKRLIVLSDMRQVGRGYNFERHIDDPASLVKKVQQEGLIPDLTGVQVWMLGVHTAGIDERQWRRLYDFWNLYNEKSGSELKTFSPDRIFIEK